MINVITTKHATNITTLFEDPINVPNVVNDVHEISCSKYFSKTTNISKYKTKKGVVDLPCKKHEFKKGMPNKPFKIIQSLKDCKVACSYKVKDVTLTVNLISFMKFLGKQTC